MKVNKYIIGTAMVSSLLMTTSSILFGYTPPKDYIANLIPILTVALPVVIPYIILFIMNKYTKDKVILKSILITSLINIAFSVFLLFTCLDIIFNPTPESYEAYVLFIFVPILQIAITFMGWLVGLALSKVLKK